MARTSREGDRVEQAVPAASSITLRNGACHFRIATAQPTRTQRTSAQQPHSDQTVRAAERSHHDQPCGGPNSDNLSLTGSSALNVAAAPGPSSPIVRGGVGGAAVLPVAADCRLGAGETPILEQHAADALQGGGLTGHPHLGRGADIGRTDRLDQRRAGVLPAGRSSHVASV